jgi:membrane fusion protein (multidrug efflux system)
VLSRVKKRARALGLVLPAVVAVLVPGMSCRRADPASSPAPPPPPTVSVARPRRGAISRTVTLPATVRAWEQAVLYAKVAGYLKTIKVDRGDRVREGQLLAEIESPELVADLARQKAEVAVAEVAWKRVSEAQKKAPDLVMPQTVDDAKGKLDEATATLERTRTLLSYTRIVSPLSGIVTRRSVDPGAFIPAATSGSVAQSSALLTVMDMRTVRVDVPVPEPEVPLVKVGLPVEVTVDELKGRTFRGHVNRFAYALEEDSKTMTAEAEIPNSDGALRPGMYARVRVAIETKPDALLVPGAAVVTGKDTASVFVVADGKAKRVPVKTGFRDESNVEILDGLRADEPVILAGSTPPVDGQPVRVAESVR